MSRTPPSSPLARVFVIEDDAAVRDSLLLVIEDAGFTAQGFADGFSFLEAARPTGRDIVVLDLDLPGISGPEIAAVLRERQQHPAIAVISGLRSAAFRAGVERIAPMAAFRKPLNHADLVTALRGRTEAEAPL